MYVPFSYSQHRICDADSYKACMKYSIIADGAPSGMRFPCRYGENYHTSDGETESPQRSQMRRTLEMDFGACTGLVS